MSTASNSSLKQSCSALTSVTSALEVIFNVVRSINPRFTYFYLLTYIVSHYSSQFWAEVPFVYQHACCLLLLSFSYIHFHEVV